jgi:hypothetical protein
MNIRETFKANKKNSFFNSNLSSFALNGISSVTPITLRANQDSFLVLSKLIKSSQIINFAKNIKNTGKKFYLKIKWGDSFLILT